MCALCVALVSSRVVCFVFCVLCLCGCVWLFVVRGCVLCVVVQCAVLCRRVGVGAGVGVQCVFVCVCGVWRGLACGKIPVRVDSKRLRVYVQDTSVRTDKTPSFHLLAFAFALASRRTIPREVPRSSRNCSIVYPF